MRSVPCPLVIGIIAAICAAMPTPARAQNVTVTMTADRTHLSVGETFELRIRAEVRGTEIDDVQVPSLDPFRVVRRQVSNPMQFRLGFGRGAQVVQATTIHRLTLEATEPGEFEIEPAHVRTRSQTHRSNPLTVVVDGSGSVHGRSHGSADAGGAAPLEPPPDSSSNAAQVDGAELDERAFLRTVADDAEPWVGEQVTVTVYLYVRGDLRSSPVVLQEPKTDGFWVHDLLPPSRSLSPSRQVVQGTPYKVYELRRFAAFPLRPGELSIGPMEVQLETGSLFDALRGHGRKSIRRAGVPIRLEAKPLPDPDRQAVVGRYDLGAELDRSRIATGDAVTLKATVEGTGNIRDVRLELPSLDGLRVLEPDVRDDIRPVGDQVAGTRVFEWLLIPDEPGDYELPALGFEYFDPESERYGQAEAAVPTLVAAGTATDGRDDETVAGGAADEGSPGRPQFGPVRTSSKLRRSRPLLPERPWYGFALAVPPLAWVGVVTAGALRKKLRARDSAGAPKRLTRSARQRLTHAERHARNGAPRAFYADVAQALKTLLEVRLGESIGGLTHDQLRAHLRQRGMDEDLARRIIDELEGSDFARFSATGVSFEEMSRCLDRTRALLDRLERFAPADVEDGA